MTVKPLGSSRACSACHPGRSKRHPHHEAHDTSSTFLPRCSESERRRPVRSGSEKSGASSERSVAARAAAAVPLFKRAQALQPESWCFKRQAWALTDAEKFYGTNFQKEVAALAGRPYYTPLDLGG